MSIELLILAVILSIPYSIYKNKEDKRKLEEAEERQRIRNEENKQISRKQELKLAIQDIYCKADNLYNPKKAIKWTHYNAEEIEKNYNKITELEREYGIVLPISPNYNQKNKDEYLEKLRIKKFYDEMSRNIEKEKRGW